LKDLIHGDNMTEDEYELFLAELNRYSIPKPTEPNYDRIPPLALKEVAKVMSYTSDDTWMSPTEAKRKFFNTAQLHQWEYRDGEELDKTSQLHHLAHAIASLMSLCEYLLKNNVVIK